MTMFELSQDQRTLIGFNLQNCPTKSLVPLDIKPQLQNQAKKVLYKNSPSKQSCNLAYLFYVPNIIFTFEDCEPYKTPTKTNIRILDKLAEQLAEYHFFPNLVCKCPRTASTSFWSSAHIKMMTADSTSDQLMTWKQVSIWQDGFHARSLSLMWMMKISWFILPEIPSTWWKCILKMVEKVQ